MKKESQTLGIISIDSLGEMVIVRLHVGAGIILMRLYLFSVKIKICPCPYIGFMMAKNASESSLSTYLSPILLGFAWYDSVG